jgi:hypothetical protein
MGTTASSKRSVQLQHEIEEQILEWRATGSRDLAIANDLNTIGYRTPQGTKFTEAYLSKHYPREVRKSAVGALVMYCGHQGFFVADIIEVADACVVRASGPVSPGNIVRTNLEAATHHIVDFPVAGYWKPEQGIFVVPAGQVKVIPGR